MSKLLAVGLAALCTGSVGAGEDVERPGRGTEPLATNCTLAPCCCACCQPCGPRFWATSEYLLWWIKDAPLPVPLLTTGPAQANLTPTLGLPGRTILIGGEDLNNQERSGGRFTAGCWLDDGQTLGVEASYFFLASRSVGEQFASAGAPGSPFLGLPFFDVVTGRESSTRVALPGGFAGAAVLTVGSRMQGAEANGIMSQLVRGDFRLSGLAGFRYLNLNEQLTFSTSSPSIVPPPDIFQTTDQFDTTNHFYGGQVGARAEYESGKWLLRATGKVALGDIHQELRIRGQLATTDFSPAASRLDIFPGGYFALPTNIGRTDGDRFAVVPEVNVTLGYAVTQSVRVFTGYTFLYVSDVLRPGNQIDRGINPVQSPAITGEPNVPFAVPERPQPLANSSDFWAQGLSFGLELRY